MPEQPATDGSVNGVLDLVGAQVNRHGAFAMPGERASRSQHLPLALR